MKVPLSCNADDLRPLHALGICAGLTLLPCCLSAQDTPPATLLAPWPQRQNLDSHGVQPFATLTTEAWGNAAGGLRTGAWYDHLLDFGLRLDTAKLGWWEGGSFLVQGHWVQHAGGGPGFDTYTGAFNPVSSIMAEDQIRVFNLYYRHAWQDDKVVLKVGQIAVDDDFMTSEYSGLFLNSAFGAMPSQVGTPLGSSSKNCPAFPIYSVAAPGAFLAVRPVEAFYSQLGLYYGKPGFDTAGNHGFDWAEQSSPELGLFWENGLSYQLADHAATLRLGLSYHTGSMDDFDHPNADSSFRERQATPNYYAVHDLQLLKDKDGKTKLGLFCRAGLTPDQDLSMVSFYGDTGLNWFAPLSVRPDDVAGVALSYTRFGDAFRTSTGPNGLAEDETTLELTYKAKLTSWLSAQADTQLLFNPAAHSTSESRQTALVVGLRAVVTF